MGLPSAAVHALQARTDLVLSPETWPSVSRTFLVFFKGVHVPWVADASKAIENADNDAEVLWILFGKLPSEYEALADGCNTAQALWSKLEKTFEASTMSTRMNARQAFVNTKHDPSKPIDVYLANIDDCVRRLDRLSAKPTNLEIKDTILMNLDDSFSPTRLAIVTALNEPSLTAVKEQLRSAGSSVPLAPTPIVKEEEKEIALAARSRPLSSTRGPRPGRGKFRWCSAIAHDQCRRCGITGHIADRCIHDMPKDIKDWVMAGPPSRPSTRSRDADDDEDAGFGQVDSDADDDEVHVNFAEVGGRWKGGRWIPDPPGHGLPPPPQYPQYTRVFA